MDLCLKANDEELYYKSWSNLATFIFRTNAQKGLKVTDEMREYAKEHDSKYGIVTALYTQANLSVKVDMIDRAVKLCQQAIEYKNQYLPEVNCTHIYWMLARIHLVKFQREETLDALEKCQQEPDLTPNQQMYILAYKCEEIDSIKNRLLLIYTDGLNEAENPQQEQFGDDRLLEVLRRTNFDNARQVIESLKQEVETYRNGAEPNDDFTMMCLNVS